MTTTVSRKDQLIRAARARASVVAFLTGAGKPATRQDINSGIHDTLDAVGYNDQSLDNILYTMSKSGLIKKLDGPGHATYVPGDGSGRKTNPVEATKSVKPTKSKQTVVVDIIKSTGRIRISLNGINIEIGVID